MLAQEGMTIDEAIAKEEFLQEECAAVIGGSSMTACSYKEVRMIIHGYTHS